MQHEIFWGTSSSRGTPSGTPFSLPDLQVWPPHGGLEVLAVHVRASALVLHDLEGTVAALQYREGWRKNKRVA